MEKAKRSPFLRVAAVMVLLCLAFTCILSGTLAKYTSTASGSASARVAKWEIKINNREISTGTAVTDLSLDLFATVGDDEALTTDDVNVDNGTPTAIIAPGTGGQFALKIDNTSEVNAKYSLTFDETNAANIPIQYSLDGQDWKDDITDVKIENKAIGMKTGTFTDTIYWRWTFAGDDTADTALGIQDTADIVTVKVNFTATQVD